MPRIEVKRTDICLHCGALPSEEHRPECGSVDAALKRVEKYENPTKQREGDQVLPTANEYPCVQDVVIADIEDRKKLGVERYGTLLQPFNGRDSILDWYEELLDGAIYARQLMIERVLTKFEWRVLLMNGQSINSLSENDARRTAAMYLGAKAQFRSDWRDA
jgi:hypothetical protein